MLYDDVLQYDPANPAWSERDRFVLSKGHGCLALYVILAEKGFFPESELTRFCRSGALLGGHPEHGFRASKRRPGASATVCRSHRAGAGGAPRRPARIAW